MKIVIPGGSGQVGRILARHFHAGKHEVVVLGRTPSAAPWRAVVWDGHGAHTAKLLADVPVARVRLPPYSPELNPAERVFQEVRRRIEGDVYPSLADKQAAAEVYLSELATDPARVRQLCGWAWLTAALDALPAA